MNTLGSLILISSFAILLFSLYNTFYGIWKQDKSSIELGRSSLKANFFLILLAFFVLLIQLFRTDLSNYYVAMHSSEHLPLFYKLTSIWSGSSGSLLFWNLLLNLFSFITLQQTQKNTENRIPFMHAILATLGLFFTFLAVFYKDAQPFLEFQPSAAAGRGLNPLLQHWAMIIHPPILYVGYVSVAIPFAIAMSSLLSGNITNEWMVYVRKWSLFSWFFLGTGILLGSKWAYEELGWGGYWAWDPVENASLMPWLLMSAFVHSIIIQERRGMLKFWNYLLVHLAFHFSLLGTWITRSGVLEGPHSFSKSTIGTPFIILIGISFVFFLGFILYRRNLLKPERNLEAVTSREGAFLFNNFLLVFGCLAILLGVFSPLLYGKEFKSPWFNSWGVPSGIFLLVLMGTAPLLAWRKGADREFLKNCIYPFVFATTFTILYILLYSSLFIRSGYTNSDVLGEIYSVATVFFAMFTLVGIVQEYAKGVIARRKEFREPIHLAFWNLLTNNKRRYGGYLVHLAILLIFVGYAGNAFKQNTSIPFYYKLVGPSDDSVLYASIDKGMVGNYQIKADTLLIKPMLTDEAKSKGEQPSLQSVIVSQSASYQIFSGKEEQTTLLTERRFYPQISHLTGDFETQIPTSEPAILAKPKEDLYIQLGAIEEAETKKENPDLPILFLDYYFTKVNSVEEKMALLSRFPKQIVANLEIWVNPLTQFIWIGSLLYFFSGLFLLLPIGERRNAE